MTTDYFYSKYKTNDLFKELDQVILFGIGEQGYFQIGKMRYSEILWRSTWLLYASDVSIGPILVTGKWADWSHI